MADKEIYYREKCPHCKKAYLSNKKFEIVQKARQDFAKEVNRRINSDSFSARNVSNWLDAESLGILKPEKETKK